MERKGKEQDEFAQLRKKCRRWYYFSPVKKNKIFFSQFGGKGYGCNPRAICDEFLRRGGYDLVWALGKSQTREKARIPEGVRVVYGDDAYYEMITSRVWINNIHFAIKWDRGLRKKKNTIYLNTFHGGITLKAEGSDRANHKEKPLEEMSVKERCHHIDSENVDYITCGCDSEKHVLEEFFYGHGEILKFGDARTDMLVNGSPEYEKAVRDFYGIPEGTRLVLYAPTFRDDMNLECYDLDFGRVLDTLQDCRGGSWKMLIRLHPRLAGKTRKIIPKDDPRLINAGKYPDMQELSVASDIMISDYSSAITDFMLTRRPAFMYVPDLEKYRAARGLYYSLDELPFPHALNNDELVEKIRSFDPEKYQADVQAFIDRIGYLADGHAAERIVDFLIEKMK